MSFPQQYKETFKERLFLSKTANPVYGVDLEQKGFQKFQIMSQFPGASLTLLHSLVALFHMTHQSLQLAYRCENGIILIFATATLGLLYVCITI